jgi:hypothetical protein
VAQCPGCDRRAAPPELVADIWAADAREARYVAERAVSVARFARRRRRRRAEEFGTHADVGPTVCWNLCCLCRRRHRIKTFPRDRHFQLLADGRLLVRTPSGVSRVTRPPGWTFETEPDPDPPWLGEEALPDRLRC